ncbi:hypothetical protein [Actinoallomurus iriomotensis]|uniref:WD40 repeat domain-containing protein n=1 Tax=Actinoallomurus iriomotensis TaxID=478107 RepID=A0A9W6VXW6_9ACTN|nr:hypothetical protein [Actinoallomurus iriomotensis]GLY83062.1 hypothetical protein Airi02_009920 [Actinoallomurus iriomotensis]
MNTETQIKNACAHLSAQARVPAGLTDRVLAAERAPRRLRRPLGYSLAAGAAALLVGAGVGVTVTHRSAPKPTVRTIAPVTLSSDTSLRTDLGSTFPRHLVAAGHTAVAAYYTAHQGESGGIRRTWYLYDPGTGTYEKTPWAYLDVAPGMHQAAVIEGPLPAPRIGILDMATRKVTRWISVGHKVGGVAWAPDGRRLVLTAYAKDPDVMAPPTGGPGSPQGSRTGFAVVDSATGHGVFHALPPHPGAPGSRQDLGWSRSGTLLWAPTETDPAKVFYDLNGSPRPAPAHEADAMEDAGLSPNGALAAESGPPPGPSVTITNLTTGKKVTDLPIEQARAWADDGQLFAVGCAVKKCTGKGEFNNRLLLVTLQGKITPLTGYHRSDKLGAWVPVFTHR